MNIADKLSGKRVLIWGYGREGQSTERFLTNFCKDVQIEVFEGKREDICEEKYDYIVKSPGIVMEEEHPKYTSQTELFLEQFRDQTIGITGTKGKSTTSTLLYTVLSKCMDREVLLLGNIGQPCLDYYGQMKPDTIVVFEMSCHQLAHGNVSPHIGLFLNLFEEHLDYYGTVEKYFTAKSHVATYQKEGDFFLVGENVPEIKTKAEKKVFGEKGLREFELSLLGNHNQYNANFVYEVAVHLFGCDEQKVKEAMKEFHGLKHRLEFVGQVNGVSYYDDSISTIPEATISATRSIPNTKTVLVGGMDRHINYDILVAFIKAHEEYQFILAYESGKRIYDALGKLAHVHYVEDLKAQVSLAKQITPKMGAVVLSPAAASYGYFKNFEERGDVFCQYVRQD
ncbi:MAG: UDP-N-acetylmuramoyl-L-alanine--D-glutamate ligase [Lachnospiraceae bacterium]|nr:UDP-N-acetylmuramoyl-L-alanine--D-glutamate ligase [Lachnospiraceae bacterium]